VAILDPIKISYHNRLTQDSRSLHPNPDLEKIDVTDHTDLERFF
jgi:hypothetical protein